VCPQEGFDGPKQHGLRPCWCSMDGRPPSESLDVPDLFQNIS
jgi:hypothetical protein